MLTLAQADVLIGIFSTLFVLVMLGAFTVAVFSERHRRNFAILSGIMAALVLAVMVFALAAPYLFS